MRTNILDRIIGRAEGLQTKYVNALNKIDNETSHLGDIKAHDYTATKVSGGGNLQNVDGDTISWTPTEARGNAALDLAADKEYLIGLVRAAELALAQAHEEADKILGRRTFPVERCTATGREGAIEWGRPDCWDSPIRGTLCAACYHRERRWRQEHGLPTREEAAA